MMESIHKGIIQLVRSALTGTVMELPSDLPMEEVYRLGQQYHLSAMLYEGALLCGIDPSLPAMEQLKQAANRFRFHSRWQLQNVQRLCAAFDKQGIHYMPMKGCNMKKLYPKPEFRYMSDADILIKEEEYDRIRPIMLSLGFTDERENDYELGWRIQGFEIELHKRMHSQSIGSYDRYFQVGWDRAIPDDDRHTRHHLSDEDTFIHLLIHFAKHYRCAGIGCLHVVDLWMYLRTHPQLDWVFLEEQLEKLSLLTFFGNLRRLFAVWFEDAESDPVTEHITQMVFCNGAYGRVSSAAVSNNARKAGQAGSVLGGKISMFFTTLFPGLREMQGKYPILKRWPVLLPVMWIVRMVDFLRGKTITTPGQKVKEFSISKDEIESFQEALEYVGLEFRKES